MRASYSRRQALTLILAMLGLSLLLIGLPSHWAQADPPEPAVPVVLTFDSQPPYSSNNVPTPLLPAAVQGTLKTFDSVADAEVRQSQPNSNFGILPTFDVGYDNYVDFHQIQRALLHFDVTTYLAPGTAVHQATLKLYYSGYCDAGTTSYQAHGIAGPWTEMTVTWNNQPGTTQAYEAIPIQAAPNWGYYEFDVTGLVQAWVSGQQSEYGIKVTGPESPPYACAYRTFRSKGGGGFDSGPLLQVDFTAPAPALFTSQNQVTFLHQCAANVPEPEPDSVLLSSNNASLTGWTATVTGGGNWLTVNKLSGSLSRLFPERVELSVTESGPCPSTRTAQIQVSAAGLTNSPQTVTVTFIQTTEAVHRTYLPQVQHQPTASARAANVTTAATPHRIALVIGTADYEHLDDPTSFSLLRSSVWSDNLLTVRGDVASVRSSIDASNYHQKIVLPEALATYSNIVAGIEYAIENVVADTSATPPGTTPKADLLLYFSGHGGRQLTDTAPLDEADLRDEFLAAFDTSDTPQFANHLLDDQLRSLLDTIPPEVRVAMIIDACNSGGMEVTHPNRAIVAASQENQNSWESSELEHGVFTFYMLQAALLDPSSDTNGDGWLSVREIYHYSRGPVAQYVSDNTIEEQDLFLDAPQDMNVIAIESLQ